MRRRIFEIVEKSENKDAISSAYDIFMLIVIFVSIIPITLKNETNFTTEADYVCAYIFILDYILRWVTNDLRSKSKIKAFIMYPITPMAILDLLAILPSFNLLNQAFRVLKVFRAIRVLRVFKTLRYSKNFALITRVIKNNASLLLSLLGCAVFYMVVSALFIFSIEPDNFGNFFEALYWATTALTTVGYGDIYPITDIGRLISMISSFFGVAMIALPSGVITAGFMNELQSKDRETQNNSR